MSDLNWVVPMDAEQTLSMTRLSCRGWGWGVVAQQSTAGMEVGRNYKEKENRSVLL